jgi:hypothetical protein
MTQVRTFDTGATRDSDDGKFDYEGFLSPAVLEEFAAYMHRNRVQSDGSLRASDNWQKGIPVDQYMKSWWRHFMDVWMLHRGLEPASGVDMITSLCACLFNNMGMLHELLNEERETQSLENLNASLMAFFDKTDGSLFEDPWDGTEEQPDVYRATANSDPGDETDFCACEGRETYPCDGAGVCKDPVEYCPIYGVSCDCPPLVPCQRFRVDV